MYDLTVLGESNVIALDLDCFEALEMVVPWVSNGQYITYVSLSDVITILKAFSNVMMLYSV